MKISKEQEMGQEMKKSHDKLSISNFPILIEGRMKMHRRKMDNVQRMSGFKLIQDYSLTKHCFHTGLLFMEYAEKENIEIYIEDIDLVFKHDILETVTGDLLYPAKNYNEHTKTAMKVIEQELTRNGAEFNHLKQYMDGYAEETFGDDTLKLFKAVDILELWEFCNEEYLLGNQTVIPVINNCGELLSKCGISSIEKRIMT